MLFAAAAGATASCGDVGAASSVTRETLGDTTFVRVSGAGEWGVVTAVEELRIGELEGAEAYTFGSIAGLVTDDAGHIYVVDDIADEIRVFDDSGVHLRSFARNGSGPGELKDPSGMVLLPDGRLAVRDFGNSRINVYAPDGTSLTTYRIPPGLVTDDPMYLDRAGNLYTQVVVETGTALLRVGLVRIDTAGAMQDSVLRPEFPDPPLLSAERISAQGRSRSVNLVPFWPSQQFTLSRDGGVISGFSDRYSISVAQGDGTFLRLERDVAPEPVQPAEAEAARERVVRSMQNLDPAWRWNGPEVPLTKPYFRDLFADVDGRTWVQLSRPGTKLPPDPAAQPDARGRMPVERWREELAYDVWDADGTLLGTVVFPPTFELRYARGAYAWGTVRDEYDVEYVVRMRFSVARTASAGPRATGLPAPAVPA